MSENDFQEINYYVYESTGSKPDAVEGWDKKISALERIILILPLVN